MVGQGSSMNWSGKRPVLPRSVYSSIRLFVYSSIRLFVYSSIRLFVYSSIRLFVYSSIRLFLMKQKRKQRKTTSPGHGLDLVEKRTGKRDRITC